jgi:hypothetical protein
LARHLSVHTEILVTTTDTAASANVRTKSRRRRQLHVLVERVGSKRRSDALLAQLDQAFENGGITTYPRLTDPDLESQDRVYILDTANPIKGLAPMRELFRDEKTLQEFIRTHHDWFPRCSTDEVA